MILYGQQNISTEDIKAVSDILSSSHLTQGNAGAIFEENLAQRCNASFALTFSNATSALHCACLALGLNKAHIAWTSPISFVASANCVLYCGAQVDFVDINEQTGNLCVLALTEKLAKAKKCNKVPKVLILVHLAGQSCDMEAIFKLSQEYGFKIIEDASHAIGGEYQNHAIGSCKYSDITIFSFHPVKIITTGEGGAALTNSTAIAEKLSLLRSHGITRAAEQMKGESEGPWYYQQVSLGFNYRMTDIQAALGTSQLTRLTEFVEKRNTLAAHYDKAFENTHLQPLSQSSDSYNAYHLYIIKNCQWNKASKLADFIALREKGIQVHVHYIPIHLQPFYQDLGFKEGDFPQAEKFYQQALTLPLHPKITEAEQAFIIDSINSL